MLVTLWYNVTVLCKRSITVSCKVLMTDLFVIKLFHLVSWTQHYKIIKVFWTRRNLLFSIWWEILNMPHLLYIIAVSCPSLKRKASTYSMGYIPVARIGMALEQGMCRSVAKKYLGQLGFQGAPSSKFNSSCQAVNSFDQQKSLMLATSASSWPLQAYLTLLG